MKQRAIWNCTMFRDIFVNAVVCDEAGNILFISCYGRDTAIQQFLAAFHLPVTQGGVDRLVLQPQTETAKSRTVCYIGDADRLDKHTSKLPRRSLFGELTHAFIFDPIISEIDQANGIAWVLSKPGDDEKSHQMQIWQSLQALSPVPLLNHWQEPLLNAIKHMIKDMTNHGSWPCIGEIRATKIELDTKFLHIVSDLVRGRILKRDAVETESETAPLLLESSI